jgi:hypothetical protein
VIARFEEAGFDVDEAWRLLSSMQEHTATGLRLAEPVAEAVITLQASDWPDPAETILREARSDISEARASLRSATGTAKEIVQFLRQLHDRATDVVVSDTATTTVTG